MNYEVSEICGFEMATMRYANIKGTKIVGYLKWEMISKQCALGLFEHVHLTMPKTRSGPRNSQASDENSA